MSRPLRVSAALSDLPLLSPRMMLLIGGAGAAIGLAIAGAGLFSSSTSSLASVPPDAVALVNQQPIATTDFTAQVEMTTGKPFERSSPGERQSVLDDMVRDELFVQRGLETGQPEVDTDVRNALVGAVQSQIDVDAMAQTASEADLKAFYSTHLGRYLSLGLMVLRDIITQDTPRGNGDGNLPQAAAALRRGTPLPTVKRIYHVRESGKVDGDQLYFAVEALLGHELDRIAVRMKAGEIVGPLRAPDGLHILQMVRNEPPAPRPFEHARSQVLIDYREASQERMRRNEYRYLRGKADLRFAPGYR